MKKEDIRAIILALIRLFLSFLEKISLTNKKKAIIVKPNIQTGMKAPE
jgi:hypothetical protein